MFSRLSAASRLFVLQASAIVMMILIVIGGLKFTGRGKHVDPDLRDGDIWIAEHAPLAVWMRDNGWLLLAVPAGLAAFRFLRAERLRNSPDETARFVVVALSLTVTLFLLGAWSITQAFNTPGGIHRHPDPEPSPGTQPARP